MLWTPPVWTRHAAALLTLPAFILLAAAYVPRNAIKARLGHPMLLGTKLWAAAHLLANGNVADVLLFGGFLVWATLCFRAAKGRDRAAGTTYPSDGFLSALGLDRGTAARLIRQARGAVRRGSAAFAPGLTTRAAPPGALRHQPARALAPRKHRPCWWPSARPATG